MLKQSDPLLHNTVVLIFWYRCRRSGGWWPKYGVGTSKTSVRSLLATPLCCCPGGVARPALVTSTVSDLVTYIGTRKVLLDERIAATSIEVDCRKTVEQQIFDGIYVLVCSTTMTLAIIKVFSKGLVKLHTNPTLKRQ